MTAQAAEAVANTEAAASPETTPVETTGQTETTTTETEGEAVLPAYTPNFKFNAPDEQQRTIEKEFDEWARPFVTKKDVEDKFRELYTKAHGLPYAQASRDKYKKDSEMSLTELNSIKKNLNQLSSYIQGDDLYSFFSQLRIPEEKVIKYALDRVNYHQLPPEKRAEYDQALDTRSRASLLAEENQRLQQENLNTQVMLRDQELRQVLKAPEISSVADIFDSKMGVPDAFRNECIKRGAYYFQNFKKDIPADVIAREVAQEITKLVGSPATQVASPGAPSTQEMQASAEKKPVIPNIQGRGTSPAKKLVKNLEDLKQRRREM